MLTSQGLTIAAEAVFNQPNTRLLLCNGSWVPGSPSVAEVIASEQISVRPLLNYAGFYNTSTNKFEILLTGSCAPDRSAIVNRIAIVVGGAAFGRMPLINLTSTTATVQAGYANNFVVGNIIVFSNGANSTIASVSGQNITFGSIDNAGSNAASIGGGTLVAGFTPSVPGQLVAGSTVPIQLTASEYGIF